MTARLDKLLAVGGDPLGPSLRVDEHGITAGFGELGEQLFFTLCVKNGFYAFESALHVFPMAQRGAVPGSLEAWNEPTLWKSAFGNLITQPMLCFAEDVFGGQFCIRDGGVWRFDPETGEMKRIADGLEAWAKLVLDDYSFHTGHPLAREWQRTNGSLIPTKRLMPKKPFVIGGDYVISNLFAMDAVASMRLRGEIAQQIARLPDGAEIEIEYR